MSVIPVKQTYEELMEGMSPFLCFEHVEEEMRREKQRQLIKAGRFSESNNIRDILNTDNGKEYEERLKLVISATHGSLEVLDRVCMVICPEQTSWMQRCNSAEASKTIADFLMDPDRYPAIPWYIRERFAIPLNWKERMSDGELYGSLQPLYNAKIGLALESEIVKTVKKAGYSNDKGLVSLVDQKEVDVIVPDINKPRILIMSSYNLTTSSAQSQRAREQKAMYEEIRRYNDRRDQSNIPDIQLINVIDGGGWLARKRDLEVLHQHCDYALAAGQLGMLVQILNRHMNL